MQANSEMKMRDLTLIAESGVECGSRLTKKRVTILLHKELACLALVSDLVPRGNGNLWP